MYAIKRTSKLKLRLYIYIFVLIIPIILIIYNISSASAINTKQASSKQINQGGFVNLFADKNKTPLPKNASFAPIIISDYIALPTNGYISSAFGYRYHPITNELEFHTGIDIAAPKGTVIYAALSGKVTKVGSSQISGNYIEITHSQGLTTLYCHCDSIIAKQGTSIKKGERIAKVGNTGITTGAHLHFEVKVNSISYDPLWIINDNNK